MKMATVSRLKASLSKYLDKVRSGEELIVTDRGKPVAKIVPLKRDDTDVPAHLLQLEREGAVRIGTGRLPEGFLERPCPKDREGRGLQSLLEEREGSR
jgi:prevent-host-death family protein